MAKKQRKLTRKQRAALARGRRLACKKLFKQKKGSRRDRASSKLERQVEALERENRKILQKERLKERLKEAKETRRALRALRRLNKPLLGDKSAGFLLG